MPPYFLTWLPNRSPSRRDAWFYVKQMLEQCCELVLKTILYFNSSTVHNATWFLDVTTEFFTQNDAMILLSNKC